MSTPAKSVFLFGFYILFMGVGLLLLPGTILGVLGLPEPQEIWVRVLGALSLALSVFYFSAGRAESTWFFRTSILTRGLFAVILIVLGLTNSIPQLILFAVIDVAAAAWTAWALRQSGQLT